MTLTASTLAQMRELHERATPGPWRFDGDWGSIPTILDASGKHVAFIEKGYDSPPHPACAANADLIALLRNNLPALLDVADRVNTLFDAIAHGSDEHRAWLQQAIIDHMAGRAVQRDTSKPSPTERALLDAVPERDRLREALDQLLIASKILFQNSGCQRRDRAARPTHRARGRVMAAEQPFTREEFVALAEAHEKAAAIGLAVGPNVAYVRTFQACAYALRLAAEQLPPASPPQEG